MISAFTFPRLLPNPAEGSAIRLRVLSLGAGVHPRHGLPPPLGRSAR